MNFWRLDYCRYFKGKRILSVVSALALLSPAYCEDEHAAGSKLAAEPHTSSAISSSVSPSGSSSTDGASSSSTSTVTAIPASFQSLDSIVGNWLKRPDLAHSSIGIEVMELPSGKVLYSLNSSRRFVSASTAKVLTTSCAFDTFGGAFKYKTRLYASGKVTDSSVGGDLVIVPSQDPTFSRSDLNTLFRSTVQKGIRSVYGKISLLPVAGGFDSFNTGWLNEDWGQEWMPASSNLIVDRNIVQGNFVLKGFKSNNFGPDQAYNAAYRSLLISGNSSAWLECNPHSRELNFYRSPGMSLGAPLVVANPSEFNQALAHSSAVGAGIKVSEHDTAKDHGALTLIAEHDSTPLWTIVQITLHESDNLYAQQLLRSIGAGKSELDSAPDANLVNTATSWSSQSLEDRGLSRLGAWLTKIGVPPQEVLLYDGCGLSRKNGISPHALNTVLKYMATPTLDGPYLLLLKRNNPVGSRGSFSFKTGTMDTVRSIAGVLQTVGGQKCAVTVMVNGHAQNVRNLSAEVNGLIALLDTIKTIKIARTPVIKDAGKALGPNALRTDAEGPASAKETTYVELARGAGVSSRAPRTTKSASSPARRSRRGH
ncbi:MAG: D-alanyl-D-alanine carboxypeptidase [Candidatus Obscuribacterales bacterium]|nr:D-alanyl-D-alanine carboxypeptidase [Candidatus Obscuribacterales bacterium]